MALKNQAVEVWVGEDVVLQYGPIKDSSGSNIDFTGATITWRMTTNPGGGTSILTKTTGSGITLISGNTTFEVAIADTDLASVVAKTYYHEVQVTLSSGVKLQLQAPSRFRLQPSAIT